MNHRRPPVPAIIIIVLILALSAYFFYTQSTADKNGALTASEATIYGRWGFGPATFRATAEVDTGPRFALRAYDDEGRVEPYQNVERITEQQAADLNALIEEVAADRAAFMEYIAKDKFIAAATLAEIPAKSYPGLVKMLERKRGKKPEAK